MARTPNYQFDRLQRERAKAAKTAEKLRIKNEAKEKARAEAAGTETPGAGDKASAGED